MGLYRSIGKPLFFGLSPEGAHHLALGLLRLPLPWGAIGGFEPDPVLELNLAGIPLRNPVGLAAGFDKNCRVLRALGEVGFGYVVGGSLTRAPRRGNPKPRIVRRPEERAVVNAMGLPNRGASHAAKHLAKHRRTATVLVSLADEEAPDVAANLALLEPLADGIELNVSSPNAPWRKQRDNVKHLEELMAELGPMHRKPLFVKLPPFRSAEERETVIRMARIAVGGGADGLTCSNTVPVEESRMSTGRGGLSGRPLLGDTVRIVREVRAATAGAVPINASGGIFTAEDALACIEAGASTIQVYTGMVYEGPGIVGAIASGLARALRERHTSLESLVGAA